MNSIDVVLVLVLVAMCGGAAAYIIKAKKNGAKCIGCSSGNCSSKHGKESGCGCGCGCDSETKE